MKNSLVLLFISAILISGCTKPKKDAAKPSDEKYSITLSFGGFTQTVKRMEASGPKVSGVGDTLKNYTDNLYYYVYNSSGALVNTIKQNASLASYGTITDKLPSGTYTILLMASKGSMGFSGESGASTIVAWPSPVQYWNDTFYKKITLTVGTASISQSVRLDRVVGAIEVTLTDAIAANTANISLVAQNESGTFQLSTGIAPSGNSTITKSFPIAPADIGVKNKKFLMHIMNTSTTLNPKAITLNIRGYNAQNGMLAEKSVTQVFCYSNKRTILAGELFTSITNPSASFTVTVNPVWETDLPMRTFSVK